MDQINSRDIDLEGRLLIRKVQEYWEKETCGVRYGGSRDGKEFFLEMERFRYRTEPFIPGFAEFERYQGNQVLEIGVGAGVDFSRWVRGGARAVGVDFSLGAVQHVRGRLETLEPDRTNFALVMGDGESLCFGDGVFDLVYSYGCVHHTPHPMALLREAFRVLKPGGELKAMIYHLPSWTGWLLWSRHCLLKAKPWRLPRQAIFEHLESPGTKAYSMAEARPLFEQAGFDVVEMTPKLGAGDLLAIKLSEKYKGVVNRLFQRLYPRWLVRFFGDRFGVHLLVRAKKPRQTEV